MTAAKSKGSRIEREIAQKLTDAGVPSRRIVMSGAAARYDSRLSGDVDVGLLDDERALFKAEVKARKSGEGFAQLDKWLGDNDMLFLRRNHRSPMVYLTWEVFIDLLQEYYEHNGPRREEKPNE